jgi:hypothetical protein
VKELQFSPCELLLLEAGSLGTGIVREPRVTGTSVVGSRHQATASEDVIEPLLGSNRETNETTTVAGQRPTRNNATTVGSGVFYVVRSEAISRDRPTEGRE